MIWKFSTRSEVESFLLEEFHEFAAEDVLSAFSWAFFEGNYELTEPKSSWEPRLRAMSKKKLSSSQVEDLQLRFLWHRMNPKTGGSEPADAALADWVRLAFEELEADVTFGISGIRNGSPSTRFGRVVEAVLDWRRSAANWRRVAQRAANQEIN